MNDLEKILIFVLASLSLRKVLTDTPLNPYLQGKAKIQ